MSTDEEINGLECGLDEVMRQVVKQSVIAVALFDAHDRVRYLNAAAQRLFGYAPDEAQGQPSALLLPIPLAEIHAQQARPPSGGECEMPLERKDGSRFWARLYVSAIEVDGCRWYSAAVRDLTEDRQIRDLERDVLDALTSSLSFADFGDYLCQRVGEIAPQAIPSILLVDHERRLRPWAVSRLPAPYNAIVNGMAIGEGVGSCGAAVWRGERVFSDDIATDPHWPAVKHMALPYGLRACWSHPIKRRDGSVAGVFAFYAAEVGGLVSFHERVINACVGLCALAIEREENRQRMVQLAQFDALTGLPNQTCLNEHIDAQLALYPAREMAFFLLGLNRFRDINDMLGHAGTCWDMRRAIGC